MPERLLVDTADEDLGMIGLFWNFVRTYSSSLRATTFQDISDCQIACVSQGGLFMPPFYGWLLDTRGGYLPMMISIVLCRCV